MCGVCAPAGTATLKFVEPSFSSCFVMLQPEGSASSGFENVAGNVVAMGHFGAHAETFPGDKFAAVGVGNDFDRRGVGERVIDSFAHLLEFPQCARGRRILRALHLVFERGDLFARFRDGAHRAGPVEFFRRHASLIERVIGGRERILRRHRNHARKRSERLRKIGRRRRRRPSRASIHTGAE